MQARAGAAAKGHAQVHEVGELGEPLVGLAGAHAPAQDGAGVGDAQVGGDEAVLGRDVVTKGDVGERGAGREVGLHVGRGRGLAVAEEGGDDDEVLGGREGLVLADEPWDELVRTWISFHFISCAGEVSHTFIIRNETAVPGRVDDGGRGGRTEGLVSDEGLGEDLAR